MERVRVWIAPAADPDSRPVAIWGLSPTERLRRCLRAAGVADADVACGADPPLVESGTAMLAFRGDYVFDERVVRILVERHAGRHADAGRSLSLIDPQTPSRVVAAYGPAATRTIASPAGPDAVRPDDVVVPYSSALRKSASAFVLPVRNDTRTRIENHLFQAAYKGVTDAVTKWVWPRPARAVTRLLARGHVSPNVVTGASWLLVGVATWLFVRGEYGAGLACAWLMTFLDTVDGKLARVTCTSSRTGHVLDHSLDLVHPPFWYLAWAMGLAGSISFGLLWSDPTTTLIVGGYVLGPSARRGVPAGVRDGNTLLASDRLGLSYDDRPPQSEPDFADSGHGGGMARPRIPRGRGVGPWRRWRFIPCGWAKPASSACAVGRYGRGRQCRPGSEADRRFHTVAESAPVPRVPAFNVP